MGNKSKQLSKEEIKQIKEILNEKNIPILDGRTQYELFRVSEPEYKSVVYKSGKITFNNSQILRNLLNEPSNKIENESFELLGGTDESGKGEWYGPLVIAIAFIKNEQISKFRSIGVQDSKRISKESIRKIALKIKELQIQYEILSLSPVKYNELYEKFRKEKKNLNDLLAWGHSSLIKGSVNKFSKKKIRVIVDLFDEDRLNSRLKDLPTNWLIIQKPKGEEDIAVAIASILARDRFLSEVEKLNKKFEINLLKTQPSAIPKDILSQVAKLHFSNVKKYSALL